VVNAFANLLHSFTRLTVDSEGEAEETPVVARDEDYSVSMWMIILTSHFSA
jgi:hypothetical protein